MGNFFGGGVCTLDFWGVWLGVRRALMELCCCGLTAQAQKGGSPATNSPLTDTHLGEALTITNHFTSLHFFNLIFR